MEPYLPISPISFRSLVLLMELRLQELCLMRISRHPCLVLGFKRKSFSFSQFSTMSVIGPLYIAFIVLTYIPFIYQDFNCARILNLQNIFSTSIEMLMWFQSYLPRTSVRIHVPSWWMTFVACCWIEFACIFLKKEYLCSYSSGKLVNSILNFF